MDQERNRRPGGVGKALLGALLVLVLAAELGAAGLLVWYLRLPKETEAITVPVTPLQPTEETAPEPAPTPDPEPDPAQQELLQARQALLERAEGLCAASVERQLEGLSPSQRRAVLERLIAALAGKG